ncbi:MAG TPA: tRNA pseudouridine(55) synthase TruB [Pyrinomonadaceae bacterium]|nr:tRNA pseudouridine(55) synthase TruB [Pyrinomonadaceae bacterium]
MNGILIIDKPAGITSHDVVYRVRRALKTKRVGHTGTLDPFATGVMVVLVGQATRLAQFLDKDEKEYVADVRFGFETMTGDRTGERRLGGRESRRQGELSQVEIEAVLPRFRGEIEQVPPMYSAKKVDGKKLYELARKGETIERKAVKVNISNLEITSEIRLTDLGIRVRCSAGTYIRTLAEDIARAAGSAAHLAELRRTAAGSFTIDQAITLDELQQLDDPTSALTPMETAVAHLPEFVLREDRVAKTRNGMSTRTFDVEFAENEPIRMTTESGELVAIGYYNDTEKVVQPKIVL